MQREHVGTWWRNVKRTELWISFFCHLDREVRGFRKQSPNSWSRRDHPASQKKHFWHFKGMNEQLWYSLDLSWFWKTMLRKPDTEWLSWCFPFFQHLIHLCWKKIGIFRNIILVSVVVSWSENQAYVHNMDWSSRSKEREKNARVHFIPINHRWPSY